MTHNHGEFPYAAVVANASDGPGLPMVQTPPMLTRWQPTLRTWYSSPPTARQVATRPEIAALRDELDEMLQPALSATIVRLIDRLAGSFPQGAPVDYETWAIGMLRELSQFSTLVLAEASREATRQLKWCPSISEMIGLAARIDRRHRAVYGILNEMEAVHSAEDARAAFEQQKADTIAAAAKAWPGVQDPVRALVYTIQWPFSPPQSVDVAVWYPHVAALANAAPPWELVAAWHAKFSRCFVSRGFPDGCKFVRNELAAWQAAQDKPA